MKSGRGFNTYPDPAYSQPGLTGANPPAASWPALAGGERRASPLPRHDRRAMSALTPCRPATALGFAGPKPLQEGCEMRRYLVIALAVVVLGAVISPAVGAPSVDEVARLARQAFSVSKDAKRTANKARRDSVRAKEIAREARRIARRHSDDVNANTITIVITQGTVTPDEVASLLRKRLEARGAR